LDERDETVEQRYQRQSNDFSSYLKKGTIEKQDQGSNPFAVQSRDYYVAGASNEPSEPSDQYDEKVSRSEEPDAAASVMFSSIDKNTDGRLTHGELKKFIKKQPWARELTGSESFHWKDLFAQYDTRGGVLTAHLSIILRETKPSN